MEKKKGGIKRPLIRKKNSFKPSNCIFCEIVERKAQAYRIYEDEQSLGILDIHPFTQGHCLVLSKRHVPWWHELTEEETKSLFSVARVIARKIMRAFHPDFVCLYARGRRIPHTHIFLVPTFGGDLLDRFFNTLERYQESPEEMVRLKERKSLGAAADRLQPAGIPEKISAKGGKEMMCCAGPKGGCQAPEKLKGQPKDCRPKQIKEGHGSAEKHPCAPRKNKKK